jgi:hypothetical protein
MAGEDIGRAEIEVGADTSPFAREAKHGVEEALAGSDIDQSLKKTGDDWGETLSENLSRKLKNEAPKLVHDLEGALDREKVTEHIKIEPDYDKDHVRTIVHGLANEVENSLQSSGIFGKIGQGVADAIGAGFNVSGRSPLIGLLIPVIGAIAGLILAAVEGVNGLIAALFTIPSILTAIIAQVGVLVLVFKAAGPVISAVLSAQNAKELAAALKGVAEPIATFAKSLIPIKEFFDLLGKSAAVAFFKGLGDVVDKIFRANNRELFFGIIQVAEALGKYFNIIGQAFASPAFTKFLKDLFDSIDHFLGRNGPYFEKFLEQTFTFLDKMLGPASVLGDLFNLLFINFGNWLEEASKDPEFLDWMTNQMPIILLDLGEAIGAILDLIKTLFKDIHEEGGEGFLEGFTTAIKELNDIFESEAGKLAIKGLIQLIELLSIAFFGLVVGIVSVIAFLEKLGEWVTKAGKAIGDFFAGVIEDIRKAFSPKPLIALLEQFVAPFDNLPQRLYNIGVQMIKSFIAGMLHQKNPAAAIAGQVISAVAGAFPSSPAKYGPFSGEGAPYARGISTMTDFTKGILTASQQTANNMNNAMNFGPGAVIANFYGQNPTPEQAQNLGTAVGNGIGNQLLARNARLAVRTM